MELGRLGAGLARVPAHDMARGALRHGAGPCDTTGWATTIRRWARGRLSERACWASRRWRRGAGRRRERTSGCERASGAQRSAGVRRRAAGGECAGVSGTVAATRPALAATRLGQGPRYGHCARTWACLGAQFGQLGAYAPDSVFRLGF